MRTWILDSARNLLPNSDLAAPPDIAIGPGFDTGGRTIHAVYRSDRAPGSSDGNSIDDLTRVGYLLIEDGTTTFVPVSRIRGGWGVVGAALFMFTVPILAALLIRQRRRRAQA